MNETSLNYANSESISNDRIAHCWSQINWNKATIHVNRLQLRIVKAVEKKDWNLVKRLQYLLVNSFYAKALAVKKVTSNRGGKTAGIDKKLWITDKQKFEAIQELKIKGYNSKPTRRIHIKKSNGKLRPLSIPCIKDRAMQTLFLLSLEPIAETTGDKRSFGFRKHRCCADAMEQLFSILSTKRSGTWILEGDIKGCFDNINHEWMLNNIPMNPVMLNKFLKAGYSYRRQLFPTKRGAIQGGAISPTLANMTLDGMEQAIANAFFLTKKGNVSYHYRYNPHQINIVRYADDFVVTSNNKKVLIEVKKVISKFLEIRGLELSEEKTTITNIKAGFDFLSWNFRKYNEKLIIKPSKKSINNIKKKISDFLRSNRTVKQKYVIYKLNQIIRGWCNYHQPVCAKVTFQKINGHMFNVLWKWAKRRHPNKSRKWIKQRYWRTVKSRNWVFGTDGTVLINPSDIPIVRHQRLKLDKNPFKDEAYYIDKKKVRKQAKKQAWKNTAASKFNLTHIEFVS